VFGLICIYVGAHVSRRKGRRLGHHTCPGSASRATAMSLDVAQHRVKQDIGCSAPKKYVSNLSRRVRPPRASQHNKKRTLNTTTRVTIFTNLLPNRVHLRYVLVGRAVKFLVVIHGESKRTSGFNLDDEFCRVLEYPFSRTAKGRGRTILCS
jgi:hypothetical protein